MRPRSGPPTSEKARRPARSQKKRIHPSRSVRRNRCSRATKYGGLLTISRAWRPGNLHASRTKAARVLRVAADSDSKRAGYRSGPERILGAKQEPSGHRDPKEDLVQT